MKRLLSRREKYEPGSGSHRLWLSVGGSVGFGGCWGLDVEEGVLADDFTGRQWEVAVRPAAEVRDEFAEQGDARRQDDETRKDKADDSKVLAALDFLREKAARIAAPPPTPFIQRPGVTRTAVQVQAKLSPPRATRAINRLVDGGFLEEVEVEVHSGKGHSTTRTVAGVRRQKRRETPTDLTDLIDPTAGR